MQNKFIPVCEPLLGGNELKYITDAVSSGWISSSGTYLQKFEKAFAEYCGVQFGVSVCNGTVALHLALVALGIGKGDEVIIPNFTMIASAFAVCYTGAKPVFIETDKDTWNLEGKILGIIKQNPKGNRKNYAGKLGISEDVVKEYTAKLKKKGLIERIGNNRSGYWEIKDI